MLISYYYPNPFHALFIPFSKHQFLHNSCSSEVDLIYCGCGELAHKAVAAKQRYRKPLVCMMWDLPCFWRDWTRNANERQAHRHRDGNISRIVSNLKKCDKIISASKYTQRILKEKYSIDSEQIYFYIDTKRIDKIPTLRPGSNHVMQASRFALNKRFDTTIKAMDGVNRKLICMGWGKIHELQRLAKSFNVETEFLVEKSTNVVIGLMKSAEVLVSPSLHEGWGMTPAEALYCETPVLVSDLEVFKEVYGDKVLYHKQDDPNDMREKLRNLLSDKKLQRKIVEDCRPIISEFTVDKFVIRWEKLIR